MRAYDELQPQISSYWSKKLNPQMTRIWLVNWYFQSRITLWCRYKSTNVSIGLCWQMPKFIVWRLWSIYFDHYLPLKPSIEKRRKQSCTLNNSWENKFMSESPTEIILKIQKLSAPYNHIENKFIWRITLWQ